MNAPARYAVGAAAAVGAVTVASWPFLDPASRRGLAIAAAVALPVQVLAFWLLVRYRGRVAGFLTVWAGGTLARISIIGLVAWLAYRTDAEGAVAMLVGLAGYFFGLLLLEPIYFRPGVDQGSAT